jgi:diguanylate cyclase
LVVFKAAADTEDWRKKYLDSLRSMERDERQYKDQQQSLYKLVGRLCLAAKGQSPRLDQELNRLKDLVRREVAPEQLEPMGQAIADAILEIDQGSSTLKGLKTLDVKTGDTATAATTATTARVPVVSTTGTISIGVVASEERIRALMSRILVELRHEPKLVAPADAIERDLERPIVPDELPQLIERVGGLVMQRIQGLERSRQELELLLGQLVNQLDSLNRYIEGSVQEESDRHSSSAKLNLQINGEMQALDESVAAGTDITVIRRQLRQRLDAIGKHLLDYRDREEERLQQAKARTEQMRGRMDEMESEARKLKERLTDEKRLSMLDPLTQIPNRLAYEQRMSQELERWARFSQPTCIAVWDIDQFKAINDNYGHRAGDKVLTVVAECLAKAMRSTDFIARYGGEEFIMVLSGTQLPDAVRLADSMREAVTQLGFHFRGAPVSITISCGITALTNGDEAEAAFDRADNAMYRAKEAGRNRVVSA